MWLPVVSAFLGIIAFLPANLFPVAFIFLVPLFLFFSREEKLWRLVTGAFLFRLIFSLGTVYFTLEPMLWISSLFIFLGLPISVFLFKKLSGKVMDTTCPSLLPPAPASCLLLVSLPFAWTFFDHAQAQFSLFPTYIATAGNTLGSSPFLGLAHLGGIMMLTFFVALINTMIVACIMWRFNRHVIFFSIATVVVLLFAGWLLSSFELRHNASAYENLPRSFTIAVVSTDNTFSTDSFNGLLQELKNHKTDFIVFPENMFNQQTFAPIFQNAAKELHTPILAAYDTLQTGEKYNSSILFDTEGTILGIHNKNRLTFIGEYWPFGDWHPAFYDWLRQNDPSIGDFAIFNQKNADAPGTRNLLSVTLQGNLVPFAAPICLEIHHPYDLEEYQADGARLIINQSNNRWISLGLRHYLYLTDNLKKIEAAWLGLPIISSSVDDAASIILPDGQMQTAQAGDRNYSIFFGTVRY